MHAISIYNNKGGSDRNKKALIINLGDQASSSSALLGKRLIVEAVQNRKTIPDRVEEIARTRKVVRNPSDFVTAGKFRWAS
jgi:predicted MarR family transcription regulator